jgi:hypothetical protein
MDFARPELPLLGVVVHNLIAAGSDQLRHRSARHHVASIRPCVQMASDNDMIPMAE